MTRPVSKFNAQQSTQTTTYDHKLNQDHLFCRLPADITDLIFQYAGQKSIDTCRSDELNSLGIQKLAIEYDLNSKKRSLINFIVFAKSQIKGNKEIEKGLEEDLNILKSKKLNMQSIQELIESLSKKISELSFSKLNQLITMSKGKFYGQFYESIVALACEHKKHSDTEISDSEIIANRSIIWIKLGFSDKAKDIAKDILETNDDNLTKSNNLSRICLKLASEGFFRKALEIQIPDLRIKKTTREKMLSDECYRLIKDGKIDEAMQFAWTMNDCEIKSQIIDECTSAYSTQGDRLKYCKTKMLKSSQRLGAWTTSIAENIGNRFSFFYE